MAHYQTLSWNGIPTGVKATDEAGQVRAELSPRFQATIDDIATKVGLTDGDAYLADWSWSDPRQRAGTAQEVAATVAAELEDTYPSGQLGQLRRDLISRLTPD